MRRCLLIVTCASLLALPALALGDNTTITVAPNDSLTFGPSKAKQTVGAGAIHWQWGTTGTTFAAHNVRQDDKLFYSGKPTSSKPKGFDVVPSAGSFHYYCELHGSRHSGMQGTIEVKPAIVNQTAKSFVVQWSPGTDDTGNAFDVRYRVDGGKWTSWKKHTTKAQATFGAKRKPLRVRAGHAYDVEARSESKSDTKERSSWSPPAKVQT